MGAPLSLAQRDYPRHDYYQHKLQDYPSKLQDYPSKLQDYPSKTQDYPTKPQDFPTKPQEYSSKNGGNTPVYKAQSREVVPAQRQQSPGGALGMMGSPGGGGGMRERVASPHRVTSPPVKLQEPQRMASPPVKMADPRPQHDYGKPEMSKLEGSSVGGVGVGAPRLSPAGVSSHFVQQYPERDTPSASQGSGGGSNAVWEGGYPMTPEKYPVSGPPASTYSPLPLSALHMQASPSHSQRVQHDPPEKVIDALEQKKDINYSSGNNNNNNNNRNSPCTDDTLDDKYRDYPAEKDEGDPEVLVDGCDLKKLAEVTSKMALTVLPDDVDTYNELNKHHLNGHLSAHLDHLGRPAGQLTPESTDCGSLSKSSSDGDHMMNRKRPPTKLKSKRRNILSFPHHLSVDELRVIQVSTPPVLIDQKLYRSSLLPFLLGYGLYR